MNADEINKYINILVANLSFSLDYNNLVNGSKRLLLVEGQTDKKFIESILADDVICVVANKAFGNKQGFSQMMFSCKNAIIRVVYGMSKVPILLNIPKGFEKCTVFGMIDLDYDNSNREFLSTPKLFVTDTHDLETLLLSTDEEILQRLECCTIPLDDAKKSYFLAYQLGVVRKVIYDVNDTDLSLQAISTGSNDQIDYCEFIDGYEVNVKKLIRYLNTKNNNCLSTAKEKKLLERVIKDKQLKKKLDDNTKWDDVWEHFDPSNTKDFWNVINGHDYLSILKYINQSAAEKYSNSVLFAINRDFEMDLINNYDYKCFRNTKLYTSMYEENIVAAI